MSAKPLPLVGPRVLRRLAADGRTSARSTRFVLALTVETLTRGVDAGSRRNAWQALTATQTAGAQPVARPDVAPAVHATS